MHGVFGPRCDDHAVEQLASRLVHVGTEERPDVVAADRLALFDKHDIELRAGLTQGEGNEAAGQPSAEDRDVAVPHSHDPSA